MKKMVPKTKTQDNNFSEPVDPVVPPLTCSAHINIHADTDTIRQMPIIFLTQQFLP